MKMLGAIFLVLLVCVGVAYMAGWLQFSSDQGNTEIKVNTDEMKDAAQDAINEGKQLWDGNDPDGSDPDGSDPAGSEDPDDGDQHNHSSDQLADDQLSNR